LWGFLPFWAKDASIAARMINARGETLAEKPSFRGAYKYRRCLIFADGFYEWQKTTGRKVPHYVFMQSRRPFAFAGLWSDWESPDGSRVKTCIIITTKPNALVAPIHNRMPVIVPPNRFGQWLDKNPRSDLQSLLVPYPAEGMDAYPVSDTVNNVENDRAECVLPAEIAD
jgi:putative SOS response-associated peptidase YedK